MRRLLLVLCLAAFCVGAEEPVYRAALVEVANAEWQPVRDGLEPLLREAGYEVSRMSFSDLCDTSKLDIKMVDLLVVPDASTLPALSADTIHAYLKQGGDIAAFNTPMWRKQLVEDNGEWVERMAYGKRHAARLLQHVVFNFGAVDLAQWQRTSDDMTTKTTHAAVEVAGQPFTTALEVKIEKLTSWDTFVGPEMETFFPEGHSLTVFWAKGTERTSALLIEMIEKDGSRWMCTIELRDQWRQYVLEPADFKFWESNPARKGTTFNPANALKVATGLAFSHIQVRGEQHQYWMGDFGTAKRTPVHDKLLTTFKAPVLETLSPEYKFFECADAGTLASPTRGGLRPEPAPKGVFSSHSRPEPGGFDKGRNWRWSALIGAFLPTMDEWNTGNQYDAFKEPSLRRGTPATLYVNGDGSYKNGVWVSFSIQNPDWYCLQNEDCLAHKSIFEALRKMRNGLFILDAGMEFYTYFHGKKPMTYGMSAINTGKTAREAELYIKIVPGSRDVTFERKRISLQSGQIMRYGNEKRRATQPGCYASASLSANGIGDSTWHHFHLWQPPENPSFVTVEKGNFMLDGKPWRPHGVNYMPSSGIGTEDWDYFEHWLGKRAYDPKIIQRDLEHVKEMGFNSVSIFLHHESIGSMNLVDILRRIGDLGMKANLSLRPGTPLDFEWDKVREMIEVNRLAENDTVFLYDLAWEPMHHDHKARSKWDWKWREWIAERYGSVENAEKDWGFAANRNDKNEVTNPLDMQMLKDGDHRVMVVAYRRFLDTLLYEYYSKARRLVKSVDPNHLVSFRMTLAGDPTMNWGHVTPYHYDYLAGAVDVLEPEAYGRVGDWEKVKPGIFTYAYGRWANPDLPVMWAEAGVSSWSMASMENTEIGLDFQRQFTADMYKMMTDSRADGIYWWWYPGGFRVNENSDYGILNPDGTDRSVTKVIRELGPKYVAAPFDAPIDHWIEFDRDLHVNGIVGVYKAVQEEFWQALEDGKTPGLRTAGTGTTSANFPPLAVGNTPLNGTNPPKYLDGFFDVVEVQHADGTWQAVEDDGTINAQANRLRITLTNLGESTWLHQGDHRVNIQVGDSTHALPQDLKRFEQVVLEVPLNASKQAVDIRFSATGNGAFGPIFTLHIIP
jgi:hypothetical protein